MERGTFLSTPKAELHVHLEGAIRAERLIEFATRDPEHPFHGQTVEHLKTRFATSSFDGFLENFMAGYRLLQRKEDFQIVTEDLLADLEQKGVVAANILYSTGVYTQMLGVDLKTIHDGIAAGLAQFPELRVTMILDTVINLGPQFMERTLDMVLNDRREFLGGFSVGGGLPDLDMQTMVPLFDKASKAGLFNVAHAGEVDSHKSIDILLAETDVKRIAHGCNAIHSQNTLKRLADKRVMIDVCPTSNLFTGAVQSLDTHPLKTFFEAGIRVSINTDDPLYFAADLETEYQLAQDLLQCDDQTILAIMADSLKAYDEAIGQH